MDEMVAWVEPCRWDEISMVDASGIDSYSQFKKKK